MLILVVADLAGLDSETGMDGAQLRNLGLRPLQMQLTEGMTDGRGQPSPISGGDPGSLRDDLVLTLLS